MAKAKESSAFDDYKSDSLTKPRDLAWDNWAKFTKVGEKVQGYIRDAFYRPAEGDFGAQRGITLEQIDGELVNVGIKRFSFILDKTNDLRIGDPLTVEFVEQKTPSRKGISGVKIFAFYGKNLPENAGNPKVSDLDSPTQGSEPSQADKELDELAAKPSDNDVPFD